MKSASETVIVVSAFPDGAPSVTTAAFKSNARGNKNDKLQNNSIVIMIEMCVKQIYACASNNNHHRLMQVCLFFFNFLSDRTK